MSSRRRTAAVSVLVLGVLGAGCEIIAGLQDRQLEPGDATVDATPDVGPACNPPHTVCFVGDASQCIDTTGDINHCGGCNKVCSAPDAGAFDATSGNPDPGIPSYEAGADAGYVSVPGPSCEAGACGLECGGGNLLCSGLCYDSKSFHDHCGDCMTACPASQWCHAGHCCDAGMESCDGGCIDVVGNASNCGACGNTCGVSAPICLNGACVNEQVVEIFPPTGTLYDPGNASAWGGRYYTMTFAQSQTIAGIAWRANLATSDTIYGEIWDPVSKASLAKGSVVNGAGVEQFYTSAMSFKVTSGTPYVIGVFMSNPSTVFPRKDSPTYPFTATALGMITISACWSTTGSPDIFPTSTNSWALDLKLTVGP